MKEYLNLSDYIEYLQEQLDKYGDGEVYALGECAEHESPPSCKCEWDEEHFYDYNEKMDDVIERVVKTNIRYVLY